MAFFCFVQAEYSNTESLPSNSSGPDRKQNHIVLYDHCWLQQKTESNCRRSEQRASDGMHDWRASTKQQEWKIGAGRQAGEPVAPGQLEAGETQPQRN